MTIPKDPALPDEGVPEDAKANLGESINELEKLITDTRHESVKDNDIPILDELVEPDIENINEQSGTHLTKGQLSDLVNTIDNKLTDELTELLEILKENIKDSILDEINTKLQTKDKNSIPPDQER